MICATCKPQISEYIDGRLSPAGQSRIASHLAICTECARFANDLRAMRNILRDTEVSQVSSAFEARLAERLAHAERESQAASWLRRLEKALRPHTSLWRPAIALGAAAAMIFGAVMLNHAPTPPAAAQAPSEAALVRQCVQQHRNYAGAQPLADIAAQNLANQLDQSGSFSAQSNAHGEDDL